MKRTYYLQQIWDHFTIHTVCAILGPRQVGKTTLAKLFAEQYGKKTTFFDLENPLDLVKLDNPMLAFSRLKDQLIVIDEVQRKPDLFPILRVLVDEPGNTRKFLILGSASRDLIRQSSETLAGRIGYIELPPFALFETHESEKLWLRGGFPRSYLAETEHASFLWRQSYIITFLERDIPQLGFNIPATELRRFWLMLANYHGQTFNASEIARSLGISGHIVRRYLDILAGTFMVRVLQPWFEDIHKRQVKAPKIYFRDSGILHALLGITNEDKLHDNPRLGSLWEGFALEEVLRYLNIRAEECYFWATQTVAELDLFIMKDDKRIGFEFKYADAPKTTKSMYLAIADLKLDKLIIVYPGKDNFPLTDNIFAYGLETMAHNQFNL